MKFLSTAECRAAHEMNPEHCPYNGRREARDASAAHILVPGKEANRKNRRAARAIAKHLRAKARFDARRLAAQHAARRAKAIAKASKKAPGVS
jgi:hypothetical protein